MFRRLPPIAPIQTFVAVARTCSFSQAALNMHLSQSSISRQIQQLEDHFDCELFSRDTRRVALTHAGRRLLPYAEQVLETLAQADSAVSKRSRAIVLRSHPTLALRWLLPRLPGLYLRHPGLRINVDTAWHKFPNFLTDGVDAMIEYGNGPWPHLQSVFIWQEKLVLVCGVSYIANFTTCSLDGAVLLHLDDGLDDWTRWSVLTGISLEGAQHRLFDSHEMAIAAAEQNQGLALADQRLVASALQKGRLVQVHPTILDGVAGYHLLFPEHALDSEDFSKLHAWLCDEAGADLY